MDQCMPALLREVHRKGEQGCWNQVGECSEDYDLMSCSCWGESIDRHEAA